jgi:hypothetical protein
MGLAYRRDRNPGNVEYTSGLPIVSATSVSWSAAAWTSDGGGFYHNDQTIAAVDLTRSIVLWNGGSGMALKASACDCYLANSTTVRLYGANNAAPAAETSSAKVITFGSGVLCQQVPIALTGDAGSGDETKDTTVASIKSLDNWFVINNARLHCYADAASYVSSFAYWIDPYWSMQDLTTLRYVASRTGTGNADVTKHLQLISW